MGVVDNIKREVRNSICTKSPKLKWKIVFNKLAGEYGSDFMESLCIYYKRFPNHIQEDEYASLIKEYKEVLDSLKREKCEHYVPATYATSAFCNVCNRYTFCGGYKSNCKNKRNF